MHKSVVPPLSTEATGARVLLRIELTKGEELTSFLKTVLQLVVLAHVRMCNIKPVVLVELPIVQLVVQLVGGGVERVAAVLVLLAVVIVQNGGLADGHPDDGAAVLVRAAGAAVAVAALRPQQDGGDVVDLVGGLRAGALLGDAAALAPSVAGVQDEGEEKDQEEECDEASLEEAARATGTLETEEVLKAIDCAPTAALIFSKNTKQIKEKAAEPQSRSRHSKSYWAQLL